MRHVPIAEFDDRAAEIFAAAESGEQIVITRNGRDVLKLVVVEDQDERMARQRGAVAAAYALGKEIRAKYGPTSVAEIREWLEEGRR